eukprot:GILK01008517.1.p1 GENE.GILK01008517.1~~GILK01008517.1.p1  ORF type:complete len:275 (+),score=32.95 GILK01008517.1:45-827(+)
MEQRLCLLLCLCLWLGAAVANRYTLPGQVVWGCNGLDRGLALSFDDGPADYTGQLLDTLKQYGVKATFFLIGQSAKDKPDLVKRMAAEGHTIASHTWSHANLTQLGESDEAELIRQIEDTEKLLAEITGERPYLIRPPYGAISPKVRQYLASRDYTIVMWNLGCVDWFFKSQDTLLPMYLNGIADTGGLLVMHDWVQDSALRVGELLQEFMGPGHTANPQGRRILSMQECLAPMATYSVPPPSPLQPQQPTTTSTNLRHE